MQKTRKFQSKRIIFMKTPEFPLQTISKRRNCKFKLNFTDWRVQTLVGDGHRQAGTGFSTAGLSAENSGV